MELKLFGVRIIDDRGGRGGGGGRIAVEEDEDVMRKSRSMGNLAAFAAAPSTDVAARDHGYQSDGGLVQSSRRRRQERKRGVPWTEDEHRTFLAGLEKLGKGDWRGISRNFVTTRTPTQVASHAQKYFLRQNNLCKKKRRSSLFDVVINDKAANHESSTKSSMKKSQDVTPETNQFSKQYHLAKTPYSIATKAAFSTAEVSPALPMNILSINHSGGIHNFQNQHGICNLPLVPTIGIFEPKVPVVNANTTGCAPDFRKLSFTPPQPQPSSPTQSTAASPSTEYSDLELRIAPPQPHSLNKLSAPGTVGAISVV